MLTKKTVIGELSRSKKTRLIISARDYNEYLHADIRIYFEDKNGQIGPTKKGITIAYKDIPTAIEYLQKAYAILAYQNKEKESGR